MKKLVTLLAVLFLMVGCQAKETTIEDDEQKTNVYINENKDGNNLGTERIYKDYKTTDPVKMIDEVDYCFIGSVSKELEAVIYDKDGKIKTGLEIEIKDVLKGDLDNKIIVYRDGGMTTVAQYLEYNGEDMIFSKNMLTTVTPENKRKIYTVEVVPSAYFALEMDTDYLFFVKDYDGMLEIYNDAYGMLKVDGKKAENLYTNEISDIHDIKNK